MKFKKFLTTLGCFALVLMCALTFAGCGEVASSKEEVQTFIANEAVDTAFSQGIGVNINVTGSVNSKPVELKMNGQIDKDGKGQITLYYKMDTATENTKVYVDTTKVYFEKYGNSTKIYCDIADLSDDGPASIGTYVQQIYTAVNDAAADFIDLVDDYSAAEGFTIQKKGDVEKGNVTFIAALSNEAMKMKATMRFDNFKIAEMISEASMTMGLGTASMKLNATMKFSAFNGTINLPSDLNTYTAGTIA